MFRTKLRYMEKFRWMLAAVGIKIDFLEVFKLLVRTSKKTKLNGTIHPTQKPVALCEYLIKTYTNENDLVLDNCAVSGSTLVAAKNLNRQFTGIEKRKKVL